jgi:lysophospholipase L1-like esterase
LSTALLVFYTIIVGLSITEVLLRIGHTTPPVGGLLKPYTKATVYVEPGLLRGVSGVKTFSLNRLGFRGPLPPADRSVYRIAAIGGSTTICPILDDSEEWAHLLMQEINNSQPRRVWVGNFGIVGKTSVDHLILLQTLPALIQADMAVFLMGGNDIANTLHFNGGPTQAYLESRAGYRGPLRPGEKWRLEYPRYQRLKLYGLGRMARDAIDSRRRGEKATAQELQEFRWARDLDSRPHNPASSPPPMPDLTIGLQEYRGRVAALGDRCRDLGWRCLFVTQPSVARADMSEGMRTVFGAPEGVARAVPVYNRTLMEVCGARGLECYDVAADFGNDPSMFYDEVHFNEAGARLMANKLSQYVLTRAPFAEPDTEKMRKSTH